MPKTLLLDVDGVIITGDHFSDRLESDHGLTHKETDIFFGNIFQQCLEGKADLKKEIAPFLPQWGWDKDVDAFLDYWFTVHSKIDQRIISLVEKLKNKDVKIFLATNQEKYRTQYLWDVLGFNKIFDGIFSSSQLGYLKKHPEFWTHVMNTLNKKPDDLIFFDDSKSHVVSAQNAGINAYFYSNFEEFENILNDSLE